MAMPNRVLAQEPRGALISIRDLSGFGLTASDGAIGTVAELYFEDRTWKMRHLVADTEGRQVLISPAAIRACDRKQRQLFLALTGKEVRDSPDISSDKPVSRQHQLRIAGRFGWSPYWIDGMYPTVPPLFPPASDVRDAIDREERGDSHLRSSREVIDYDIRARDGKLGHAHDFLVDDLGWVLRYLVVHTGDWLPGRKTLLPVALIQDIDWVAGRVSVDAARDTIRAGPAYETPSDVTLEYEQRVAALYDRPARPRGS